MPRAIPMVPGKVVWDRHRVCVGLHILCWINGGEHGDAFGFVTRRTMQQESADEAEHLGIHADAKSESEHGNCCEAGVLAELTDTIAAIGENGVQPIAEALLADLFFDLRDAAEFDARGMPARRFSSVSISR